MRRGGSSRPVGRTADIGGRWQRRTVAQRGGREERGRRGAQARRPVAGRCGRSRGEGEWARPKKHSAIFIFIQKKIKGIELI
jgi:hypothetical protein